MRPATDQAVNSGFSSAFEVVREAFGEFEPVSSGRRFESCQRDR